MPEHREDGDFVVVLNHELQYSIWPDQSDPPPGWNSIGISGSRESCLDHVEAIWEDMRPVSVRLHIERAQEEGPGDQVQVEGVCEGFKTTDAEGLPFFTKERRFEHRVGGTVEAPDFAPCATFGQGLHFSRFLEDAVANGLAASVWDERYCEESLVPSARLFRDGIRIFKVNAEQVVRVNKSIRKARLLRVVEEVPVSLSKLLPLLSQRS